MVDFRQHGYREFSSTQAIGPAIWPHHDLLFVHRGSLSLEFPGLGQTVTLPPRSGVLIWPGTAFQGRAVGEPALVSIQHFLATPAPGSPFRALLRRTNRFSRQATGDGDWLDQCVRRAQELARDDGRTASATALRSSLLHVILVEGGYLAESASNLSDRRIDAAALGGWLATQLERNPGVPEMAGWAGLSPSRFRTVFRLEHGLTAGEFLTLARLGEAKRRLAETDEPIKRIAAAIGYADAVVFHRAFRKRVGRTPGSFRREFRATV